MVANSVMAIESIPAVTSDASTAATVPWISRNTAEMASTTAGTCCSTDRGRADPALELSVSCASIRLQVQVDDDARSSDREPAMDRSDGWSNKRVWESAVLKRSPRRVESAVAAMESSPVDMRGTSAKIVVPTSSEAETPRSRIKLKRDYCAQGRRPHSATRHARR